MTTPMRKIENDDLWSAIRGLGMYKMANEELSALHDHHTKISMFASQVIAEAARQILATRS